MSLGQPKLSTQSSHPAYLCGQQNPVKPSNLKQKLPKLAINISVKQLKTDSKKPGAEATKTEGMNLLDALSFELGEPVAKMQRERPKEDIMSMTELMAAS